MISLILNLKFDNFLTLFFLNKLLNTLMSRTSFWVNPHSIVCLWTKWLWVRITLLSLKLWSVDVFFFLLLHFNLLLKRNWHNSSSNINEVIRSVLNFLSFFFTIRFDKYKKAFFYQYRLKVDLVLYTYVFIYLKATIKKFIFTWVLILLLI